MTYTYGNSWEKYPIKENEVWMYKESKITVRNIFDSLPYFFQGVEMIYVDPPWNLQNINAFYTKAERNDYLKEFEMFYFCLFNRIKECNCKICYVEIGKQYKDMFFESMKLLFPVVNIFKITYYRRYISYLIRGSYKNCIFDFSGMDDMFTPTKAIEIESPISVGDFCAGRGLTGISAFNQNKIFYGMELNKRRLAVMIDKLEGLYEKSKECLS